LSQPLTFRPAEAHESEHGARLLLLTLHQFGDYLFGFGDHTRAQAALEKFFSLPANRFSHQFAVFGQVDGEIAGILMLFNRRQMRRSMAITGAHMFRVYRIKEILKFLELMLPYRDEENIPEDELYIGHLAVYEKFRRQGFGFQLLEFAEKEARAQGKSKLTLLTEIENISAQALYNKFGFKVTNTIYFPEQRQFVGSAGDVRMEKNL
jgi:ribosomal protein S18 acetylase RimI-like enzyme